MYHSLIENNIKELIRLHSAIKSTFITRKEDKKSYGNWVDACAKFHENYCNLAFPGELNQLINHTKNLNPEFVEIAIAYLEVNPYFFRSGYTKEKILTILKRVALTDNQKHRLQNVILHIIDCFHCREFRYYCRLAKKISLEAFVEVIRQKRESADSNVAKRAEWVLNLILK